jgi:DNA-binding Lrp family transcriptional regulator
MVFRMRSSARVEMAPTEPRLDERILEALAALAGTMAFSGLRRALRAHPESLSRALRRLEREGLVERSDGGYRLLGPPASASSATPSALRTIAEIALLPGRSISELRGRLTGRWFGSLRWVGTIESPQGPLLMWSRRDSPGRLLLSVEEGRLRVLSPERGEAAEAPDVEEAAYELLLHVLEDLRPSPQVRGRAAVFFSALPDAFPPGES